MAYSVEKTQSRLLPYEAFTQNRKHFPHAIVGFLSAQCPHCREFLPRAEKLVSDYKKANPNVDVPILFVDGTGVPSVRFFPEVTVWGPKGKLQSLESHSNPNLKAAIQEVVAERAKTPLRNSRIPWREIYKQAGVNLVSPAHSAVAVVSNENDEKASDNDALEDEQKATIQSILKALSLRQAIEERKEIDAPRGANSQFRGRSRGRSRERSQQVQNPRESRIQEHEIHKARDSAMRTIQQLMDRDEDEQAFPSHVLHPAGLQETEQSLKLLETMFNNGFQLGRKQGLQQARKLLFKQAYDRQ